MVFTQNKYLYKRRRNPTSFEDEENNKFLGLVNQINFQNLHSEVNIIVKQ